MRKTGFSVLLVILLVIYSSVFTLPAGATVTVETTKNVYAGSGTTGPFTYAFKIWTSSDLRVIKTDTAGVETTLVLNADYTVTGAGVATGGTVTLTSVLPAGYTLTLMRDMDYLQGTSFTAGQAISAASINQALDKLEHHIQQLKEQADRAAQLPRSSALATPYLPKAEAGKILGWNSAATGLYNYSATGNPISIFYNTLVTTEAELIAAKDLPGTVVVNFPITLTANLTTTCLLKFNRNCPITTTGFTRYSPVRH